MPPEALEPIIPARKRRHTHVLDGGATGDMTPVRILCC